jgi:hypothetical protein
MKSIARRIQKLEEKLLPAPETASSRRLRARIEAARRRVPDAFGESGPIEILPNETVADAGNGPETIVEMLNRGRQRARLRNLQP